MTVIELVEAKRQGAKEERQRIASNLRDVMRLHPEASEIIAKLWLSLADQIERGDWSK